MPLTTAEKSKRYRDRLRQLDPERYLDMLKKNKARANKVYREKMAKLNDEQKDDLRSQWREENRKYKSSLGLREDSRKTPLTAAEKSKRYRDKLRQLHPERYNNMLEKNKARANKFYREKIAKLNEQQKDELRARWREDNKKKYRSSSHSRKDHCKDIGVSVKIEDQSPNASPGYEGSEDTKDIQDPLGLLVEMQNDAGPENSTNDSLSDEHTGGMENDMDTWQDTEPTASTSKFSETQQYCEENEDTNSDNVRPPATKRLRTTAAPPQPYITHLTSINERFLKLEENRLTLERSNSELMKLIVTQSLERDRQMAAALKSVGDGLQALAKVFQKNGNNR